MGKEGRQQNKPTPVWSPGKGTPQDFLFGTKCRQRRRAGLWVYSAVQRWLQKMKGLGNLFHLTLKHCWQPKVRTEGFICSTSVLKSRLQMIPQRKRRKRRSGIKSLFSFFFKYASCTICILYLGVEGKGVGFSRLWSIPENAMSARRINYSSGTPTSPHLTKAHTCLQPRVQRSVWMKTNPTLQCLKTSQDKENGKDFRQDLNLKGPRYTLHDREYILNFMIPAL